MYLWDIKKSSTLQIWFKNLRDNPRIHLNKMCLDKTKYKRINEYIALFLIHITHQIQFQNQPLQEGFIHFLVDMN